MPFFRFLPIDVSIAVSFPIGFDKLAAEKLVYSGTLAEPRSGEIEEKAEQNANKANQYGGGRTGRMKFFAAVHAFKSR